MKQQFLNLKTTKTTTKMQQQKQQQQQSKISPKPSSNFAAAEVDLEKGEVGDDNSKRGGNKKSAGGRSLHEYYEGGGDIKKLFRLLRNLRAALEDWLFLALLGILVAFCSLSMDLAIEHLQRWHVITIDLVKAHTNGYTNVFSTYAVWTGYAILLVISSTFFVRLIAPQAIGSGIPEMKTILRGVLLKEYLTLRTLISKMIGLTLSLGSGMPIGKEGPFVHIASVVANLLSQCVHSVQSSCYTNESRSFEMLAAACAVGVSSTFSAPIGGVLFSIEVTSVYFAVRNYWRGFFAATCSATLFRIFRVLLNETEVTVTAFYQTKFPRDAFFPEELPIFAVVGVVCGFASALFICTQRRCILFLRRNKFSKFVFQKHWAIYPALIAFLVASLTFPDGFGRFIGGEKKFTQAAKDFFADCTWSLPEGSIRACPTKLLAQWVRVDEYGLFTSLPCFVGTYFILSILTSTLPIPTGIFGPSFVLGGAIGRLIGETIVQIYPQGIRGPGDLQIFPGIYAIVGSAAFTGGVTHTVSVAVIVFELTGQLMHILPVMIAVLISNAISSYLQPSIYDSAIRIKHLPYLPDIPHTSSRFHGILVKQFMTHDVHFVSKSTSYRQLQEMLFQFPYLKAFPIVEDEKSQILIGSCSRQRLQRNLNLLLGPQARQREANSRRTSAKLRVPSLLARKHSADQLLLTSGNNKNNFYCKIHGGKNGVGGGARVGPSEVQPMARAKSDTRIVDMVNSGEMKQEQQQEVAEVIDEKPKSNDNDGFKISPVEMARLQLPESEIHANGNGKIATSHQNLHSLEAQVPASPAMGVKRSPTAISTNSDVYSTIGEMIRTLTRFSNRLRKSTDQPNAGDLDPEERQQWEQAQLAKPVDFDVIGIDPAPFQLVEQTSLFKVHSLFSLLGLNRAYVTKCGRLIGVVALRDLRKAVEKVQLGELKAEPSSSSSFGSSPLLEENGDDSENCSEEDQQKVEEHQEQKRKKSTDDDDDDDADEANDILNPRLEIVSRAESMFGMELPAATDQLRVRLPLKKASDAFKGAVDMLTSKGKAVGVLRADSGATAAATAGAAVVLPNGHQQQTDSSRLGKNAASAEEHPSSSSIHQRKSNEVEKEEEDSSQSQQSQISGGGNLLPIFVISSSDDDEHNNNGNGNGLASAAAAKTGATATTELVAEEDGDKNDVEEKMNERLGPVPLPSPQKKSSLSCLMKNNKSSTDGRPNNNNGKRSSPQRRVRVVSPVGSPPPPSSVHTTVGTTNFDFSEFPSAPAVDNGNDGSAPAC